MPEKVMPGPVEGTGGIREAVCVHTRKIYDSCRDKDCIEDLRFYPKLQYVDVINHALSVKGGSADLLYVYVDVEPVNFNRGFYTVDMRFFYNVTLQAYTSCPAPVTVEGLCVFDKRAILFGSEGSAKIFSSKFRSGEPDIPMLRRSNLPEAVVEAVDPIVLDARLVESSCSRRDCDCDLCEVPAGHQPVLRRRALRRRRRPPDLHYSGAVLHRPSGAGFPAPGAGVRLLYAGEGVLLRQHRRSLQPVPQHQFPCGRIFPAQHCGPPGGLRGGQELLRLLP